MTRSPEHNDHRRYLSTLALTLATLLAATIAGAATLTVNSPADGSDANPGDGICDTGVGECTLRAAIEESNANFGFDVIEFDLFGIGGVSTIRPNSEYPPIQEWSGVYLNGTSQSGYAGTPVVEIDGSNVPLGSGIRITGGHSSMAGLSIHSFGAHGVILSGSHLNVVRGCHLGVDGSGTIPKPNGIYGLFISNSNENTIGGPDALSRNIISSNGSDGIYISPGSWANLIRGNMIGTDVTGTADLGNGVRGITLDGADGTYVGGSAPGYGNVISGNGLYGVMIQGLSTGSVLLGNRIGPDATGLAALPQLRGIYVTESSGTQIGDVGRGGNQISGNVEAGIFVEGIESTDTTIVNNRVGLAEDNSPLPNLADGIMVTDGATAVEIGSEAPGLGNSIAFNGRFGIAVEDGDTVRIVGNALYSNGDIAIDLGTDLDVTPNDAFDDDTGANGLQNFPVLTAASSTCAETTIEGTLHSGRSQGYLIHFYASDACDPSDYGEGETYLGELTVSTDPDGDASFVAILPVAVQGGQSITATATHDGRSDRTSEMSFCLLATGGCGNCGNSTTDPGEECDEGGIDTITCDADCTQPVCGDRHVNVPFGEECDEGATDTIDCDSDCSLAVCGDGHLNTVAGELCDDNNTMDGDGCSSTCQPEGCLIDDLTRIRPMWALEEGAGGVELLWPADPSASVYHVNTVDDLKGELADPRRAPAGAGQPECDVSMTNCVDADPPALGIRYYQVLSACGVSGDEEGPF